MAISLIGGLLACKDSEFVTKVKLNICTFDMIFCDISALSKKDFSHFVILEILTRSNCVTVLFSGPFGRALGSKPAKIIFVLF